MTGEQFEPKWMSPPGATILDILEERGLSESDFAKLIGFPSTRTSDLLSGRTAITLEVAKLLQSTLGGSVRFWISREEQYRDDVGRLQRSGNPDAAKVWLSELPVSDMVHFGWIEPHLTSKQKVDACLRFFSAANVSEWRDKYRDQLSIVAFRASSTFDSQPGSVLAWLRYAEKRSEEIKCRPWNPRGFKDALSQIRTLTRVKQPSSFIPQLQEICAQHGVAVVIARSPSGCHASAATRFLSEKKALVLLSFRYRSDDQFWFSFFHECGHPLLHDKSALFLEDGSEVTGHEEEEANRFAEELLIPAGLREELRTMPPTRPQILNFAVRSGVSRGIIVGQLQHLKRVPHDKLNWMKRHYKWSEISTLEKG
jgi:HTH-type transcriptional regulator / antitoxin HigA